MKLKNYHCLDFIYDNFLLSNLPNLLFTTNFSNKVNTDELIGGPTCPCCGNQIAFAVCVCEKIHCIGDEEISTCPWCENQGTYGSGEGGFDVNRTQG